MLAIGVAHSTLKYSDGDIDKAAEEIERFVHIHSEFQKRKAEKEGNA